MSKERRPCKKAKDGVCEHASTRPLGYGYGAGYHSEWCLIENEHVVAMRECPIKVEVTPDD